MTEEIIGGNSPHDFEKLMKVLDRAVKLEIRHDDSLVAGYKLFQSSTGADCGVVYYPCGDTDNSPSLAFPNSRVIYVDIDRKAVQVLKDAGLEAHHASALEFDPGEVSVLIMLNPEIPPDVPARYVISGGYVVCNDYHGTASRLRKSEGFDFIGIVRRDGEQGLIYDSDRLELCWQEVETDEEWRSAPFSWKYMPYHLAAEVVEAMTGKRENVLAEYRKIYEQAREQERQRMEATLLEHPEWKEFMEAGSEPEIVFHHGDRDFVLTSSLPRKKGQLTTCLFLEKNKLPTNY